MSASEPPSTPVRDPERDPLNGGPAAPRRSGSQADGGLRGVGGWGLVLVGLVVGLVLRWAAARRLGAEALEWDADGFVTWFEGWSWGAWNRSRPPGSQALWGWLGQASGLRDVAQIHRWLGLLSGLSSWVAAAVVVGSLSARLPGGRRSLARGLRWMTWLWALLPTLVCVAPHPVPEAISGTAACLLLAALAFAAAPRTRWAPTLLAWTGVAVAAAAWLCVGGLIAALTLLVSLLAYLLPVPRLGVAAPPVLALGLAGAAFWFAQRGPEATRPWLPDTGPAWSLAKLGDLPLRLDATPVVDPDLRVGRLYVDSLHLLADRGVTDTVARVGRRLAIDGLNPRRFEELRPDGPFETQDATHPPGVLALGLLDGFLRGGAFLFACAALALWPRSRSSSFPRAAVAAGLLLLALLGPTLGAGPWSLAPFDLLLAALAGAAACAADPAASALRRRAFALNGLVFLLVPVAVWWRAWPVSDWNRHLVNELGQGRLVVSQLAAAGPRTPWEQHSLARFLMDPGAPFQRFPEAALSHAEQAVAGLPTDEGFLGTLASALVENLRFDEAEGVALSLRDDDGLPTPRGRVLIQFVGEQRRRVLLEPLR